MRALTNVAIAVAGCAAAFAFAAIAVAVRARLTSGPPEQASSGMYAFGDLVLFVTVFMLALPATAAAFYVLGSRRGPKRVPSSWQSGPRRQ